MGNRTLFFSAALFNWLVGLAFLLKPNWVYGFMLDIPSPASPAMVYLFAGLVLVFGLGYFWVGQDFEQNRPLVKLGAVGKAAVFAIALLLFLRGQATPLLLGAASIDLLYAALFMHALRNQR
jgi:hypothetical protein